MKKKIAILGSTGSIGSSTLKVIQKQKYKIVLLTAKKNFRLLLKQAILFKVKNVIIDDKNAFLKSKHLFNSKKIKIDLGLDKVNKVIKKKVCYCINSISGIDGLKPTLDIIPLTENLLIANKESIICGWDLIEKKLNQCGTKFIPIDSEHFSIWELIKNDNKKDIDKIVLTASGGPFLNKSKKNLKNIKPKFALNHPNWKMGKKISIDSSNMMNKIFEYIEAKKIFNLKNKDISILIHPSSYVHAIVFYKGGLIKFLAHETKMTIPISNAMNLKTDNKRKLINQNLGSLNNIKFIIPDKKKFPLIDIIQFIPEKTSYFETILITLNDTLVEKYLNGKINYISIQRNLLKLIKTSYFSKFYKLKPKNIYDIKNMINLTKFYLEKKIKYYEN